jgi:IrrE N-terminal-like domain
MQRGFKAWAEHQAIEQRRRLGLGANVPLPARQFAAHLGITIVGPEHIPGMSREHLECLLHRDRSSWSAITVNVNTAATIIHNTGHARTRQESDLMHEIAHIICKHAPSELIRVGGLPFPLRDYNADQEEEASWLGACLQLPRPALWWAVKRRMTADEIVQYFQASEELIRYRRQVTGVDRQLSRLSAR